MCVCVVCSKLVVVHGGVIIVKLLFEYSDADAVGSSELEFVITK